MVVETGGTSEGGGTSLGLIIAGLVGVAGVAGLGIWNRRCRRHRG